MKHVIAQAVFVLAAQPGLPASEKSTCSGLLRRKPLFVWSKMNTEEKLLKVIKEVLGDELFSAVYSKLETEVWEMQDPLISVSENNEFGRLDAQLQNRRDEFYQAFEQSEASKTYDYLHWHRQRYTDNYQRALDVAERIAGLRCFRAMSRMLADFLQQPRLV